MANAKPVKQAKKQSKTNAAAKSKEDPKKQKKCSDNTATEAPPKKKPKKSSPRPSTRSQREKIKEKPPAGHPSSSSDSDVPEDTTAKPKSLAKKTQNNAKSKDKKTCLVNTDVAVAKKSARNRILTTSRVRKMMPSRPITTLKPRKCLMINPTPRSLLFLPKPALNAGQDCH
jgi:hypothetical protein